MIDHQIWTIVAVVSVPLVLATVVGESLVRRADTPTSVQRAKRLRARIRSWWWMIAAMLGFLSFGVPGILGFFGLVSLLAMRELVTLVPSRRADHGMLVLSFFVAVPVQYGLIWLDWYGLFAVFVPVWALLAVSIGVAMQGDADRFLHRIAAIHYALLVGVYCISHAPGLLLLTIPGYEGQEYKLLAFLVVVTQASDVLQYLFGKAFGRHALMPSLSPDKTVEGMVGGVLSATVVGALLTPLTPFGLGETTALAFFVVNAGWLGGMVMSAIKRDAGVKDYGAFIDGHGGVLDRVDSLVFAAPALFHVVRWLHSTT